MVTRIENSEVSDEMYIGMLKNGAPEQGFTGLYEKYNARLGKFCLFNAGVPDAEDIQADTWKEVWAHRESYKYQGKPFSAFLCTIAGNKIRNLKRDRRRHPTYTFGSLDLEGNHEGEHSDSIGDRLLQTDNVENITLQTEVVDAVNEASGNLSGNYKRILLMHLREGLTDRQIGEILHINRGAARIRIHRALTNIRTYPKVAALRSSETE